MVLIAALIVGSIVAFLLMNVVSHVQDAFEPTLTTSHWISSEAYMAYYYATMLVTNIWTYIIAIIFIILAYWLYIYNQRRSAGYY